MMATTRMIRMSSRAVASRVCVQHAVRNQAAPACSVRFLATTKVDQKTSQADVPLQTKTAVEQAADADGPAGSKKTAAAAAGTKPVPDAAPLSTIAKNTVTTAASQGALAIEKTGEVAGNIKEKAVDLKDKTVEVAGKTKDTIINVSHVVQDTIQGAAEFVADKLRRDEKDVKQSKKKFDEMTESAKQTISEAASRATDGEDDPALVKKQVSEKAEQEKVKAHNVKEQTKAKAQNTTSKR